jgi:uncharacterized membrane protein
MTANSIGILVCGSLVLLIGLMMKIFPAKKINSSYGYRTPLSLKNQETWDYANRISANLMLFGGILNFVTSVLLAVYLPTNKGVLMNLGILTAIPLIMILITETKLSRKFRDLK